MGPTTIAPSRSSADVTRRGDMHMPMLRRIGKDRLLGLQLISDDAC